MASRGLYSSIAMMRRYVGASPNSPMRAAAALARAARLSTTTTSNGGSAGVSTRPYGANLSTVSVWNVPLNLGQPLLGPDTAPRRLQAAGLSKLLHHWYV